MALIYCPECGTQVSDKAQACIKCAYPISKINASSTLTNETNPTQQKKDKPSSGIDQMGLDYYYELIFQEIYESKESYKGGWNWYAFFFSWIWFFTKGCWGWGLICLVVSLFNTIMNPSLLAIIFSFGIAIFAGVRANWIYYNVKVNNKQF